MRARKVGDVTVNAIGGTHVVFFGFDMPKNAARNLMGFAIQREDPEEQETSWLRSSKTFSSIRQGSAYDDVSCHDHPFQAFQWADYTAKPGRKYKYTVYPMSGVPGHLRDGNSTTVTVETELAKGAKHSIYFNRGAIASQAYSKRFGPNPPDRVGTYAYEWLARDLLPGMLSFIGRASDHRFGLFGAIYEMAFPQVLQAFRDAKKRGAKVSIIYGATPGDETTDENVKAIDTAGIRGLCIPRTQAKIMHNKFIILTKNDKPVAVWTGSTNLSNNAMYGQLNVGHVIDDKNAANVFFGYWSQLKGDPDSDLIKDTLERDNLLPPSNGKEPLIEVFSPHRGMKVFDWYKKIAEAASKGLFMTFPFGIVKDFRPVFDHADGVLRYAMLEKYAIGGTAASRKEATDDTIRIRKLPNIGMAVGSRITVDTIDGWMKEATGLGTFVNWVHTKFMLVDPLGIKPITITGSANWSTASTNINDENMVVIRANKRVADIYFTEFMRIFAHHRFRESVERYFQDPKKRGDWKPQDLKENPDEWVPMHYAAGSEHALRRLYFAGTE